LALFTACHAVPYVPRNPDPSYPGTGGGNTMTTNLTSTEPPDPSDYESIQATPEFVELRRRLRGFVFPMTIAFFTWYALYVVLSAYARDLMGTKVVGHINVALIFGLLQFVTTFLIAWLYERFSQRRIDPLAEQIRDRGARQEVSR
jgi:uncharacterized membrane protein (DUF485 family)